MNAHRRNFFERAGRAIAVLGVVLPLLLIGHSKFAQFEVDALQPIFAAAPWLSWLPKIFGPVGAARFLGVFEIVTAVLLLISPWSRRAGIAGGAFASLTFLVTLSFLTVLPIWAAGWGGYPALSGAGQFILKDVALLGVSLVVLGESLAKR